MSMELQFAPVVAPLALDFAPAPTASAEFAAAYVGPMGRVEGGLNLIGTLPDVDDLPETASSGDAYIIEGYLIVWTQGGWLNAGPMGGVPGPQGPPGDKGDKGDTGDPGPAGTTSWTGITDKPTTLAGFGITDAANYTEMADGLAGKVDKVTGKGLSTEDYSTAEKAKLAGISSGATANSSDATLLARANHTGTQAISTVAGLQTALDGKIASTEKGAAGGVATLDENQQIPESQIPAVAITDTYEVASESAMLALSAQRGDVAVRSDENKSYILRATPASTLSNWSYLRTPTDAVLSVAGKTGAVSLDKSDVGLGNVDNTSDANKPVSTAQATAISASTATNIHAATSKTTPVDADELGYLNSAASFGLVKFTFGQFKSWLAGLFVGKTGAQVMTGDLTVPSVNGGQLAGLRNRIDNGNFAVNQRGYVSGAATTAGQFVFDRWKVTGTGGVTFSTTANKRTVTIPSGQTLWQVVLGTNLQSGTYVLSWGGTAQGRIGGGSYGASGAVTGSLTGGTDVTIEFNAGTIENVQLELGTVATPFETRPAALEYSLCSHFYYRTFVTSGSAGSHGGIAVTTAAVSAPLRLPGMRASPTISVLNNGVANQVRNIAVGTTYDVGALTAVVGGSQNGFSTLVFANAVLTVGQFYDFDVIASADI